MYDGSLSSDNRGNSRPTARIESPLYIGPPFQMTLTAPRKRRGGNRPLALRSDSPRFCRSGEMVSAPAGNTRFHGLCANDSESHDDNVAYCHNDNASKAL